MMMKKNMSLFLKAMVLFCTSFVIFGCAKDANADANSSTSNNANTDVVIKTVEEVVLPENNDAELMQTLQKNLEASDIEANIQSVTPVGSNNLYWVTVEGLPSFFTDETGTLIIQGQIVKVGDGEPVDISAELVSQMAASKLANVAEDELIIYPAKGEVKGTIYIFTDSTCPYCRKLHEDVPQLNNMGIQVKYLAWPRHDAAVPVMEAVWCSDDRQAALDVAEHDGQLPHTPACQSPVRKHAELGMSLGVRGTPAVFTEKGEQIGGYLPPSDIANALGL